MITSTTALLDIARCLSLVAALNLISFAIASPAHADALDDLRVRLAALNGTDSLKATVDFENWNKDGDDKAPHIRDGKVTATVEESGGGLKIQWDREVLQQAELEAHQHKVDPEKDTPTRDAISALSAYDLQRCLDSSEDLLNVLDEATLTGEKDDTIDGRRAHLLLFKPRPRLSEHDRKYVKDIDASGNLWLDADGYPIAMEKEYKLHGSVMMVIRFESSDRDEYRYLRVGNRLVTTRHLNEGSGSGGGEYGQTRQITTVHYDLPPVTARAQ